MGANVYRVVGGIWEVIQGINSLGCFRSRESAIEWAESKGFEVMNK